MSSIYLFLLAVKNAETCKLNLRKATSAPEMELYQEMGAIAKTVFSQNGVYTTHVVDN